MEKTCGIYFIRNTKNNKIYIGQSVNCEERIKQHFRDLKNNSHDNIHLQRAYNKYGEESFIFDILVSCDKKNMDYLEIYYINKLETLSPNGYNLEIGGTSGKRFTEEMIKKHSEIRIGKKIGKNKRFVGTFFKSGYWEAAISIDMKQLYIGRYKTEDEAALAYDKIALSTYGRTFNFDEEYVKNNDPTEKSCSSKYIGVTKRIDKRRGRNKTTWRARVQINGKMVSLGDFSSEIEAAQKRDSFIIEKSLSNLPLNFGY